MSLVEARSVMEINLRSYIPYRMARLSEGFSRVTSSCYSKFGITSPEWRVLAVLAKLGVCSSKTLREHTILSKSHINRAVNKLTGKGLVKCASAIHDRRQNEITLTREGVEVFDVVGQISIEAHDEWTSVLTKKELRELHAMFDKLESNL